MNRLPHRAPRNSGKRKITLFLCLAVGLVVLLIGSTLMLRRTQHLPPTPLGELAFLTGRSPLESCEVTAPAGDRIYTFQDNYDQVVAQAERELTPKGWQRVQRPEWPHNVTFQKDTFLLQISRSRMFLRANRLPDEALVYSSWSPEEPGLPNSHYYSISEKARGWITVQEMWSAPLRPVLMPGI